MSSTNVAKVRNSRNSTELDEREPFGSRLTAAMSARGPLCVGVDPHPELLRAWGLADDVAGLRAFARTCVDALAGEVAVLKPQSAFFECHGAQGIEVLEEFIGAASDAGALVLADVKRGDIGSTMTAYARAYLADGAPLAVDAVTLSPYLGFDALTPAIELARRTGRGVFVLAATSNPEGASVQRAHNDGRAVDQSIVDAAAACNAGARPFGDVGVVVGATIGRGRLRLDGLNGPILAPGFGAQGATTSDLRAVFGGVPRLVLPTSSRDVLRHGPNPMALRDAALHARDVIAADVSAW
ncbi:MAG: orotidine-5'-phosphate decarboxylase [Sciscionella sp.]|nr:orotidine-5'-phosphate decarboxylase [Sciscionella sp.]